MNHWPTCCGPFDDPPEGGLEIGPKAGDQIYYTDASLRGYAIGGSAGSTTHYTDATHGGMELGGTCGDVFIGVDETEGGLEIGGECGDLVSEFDPAEGGLEIGGESGDVASMSDPTEGGLEIGGTSGDVYSAPDPTHGGLEIGGTAGDKGSFTDPTHGGLEIGGTAGDSFTPGTGQTVTGGGAASSVTVGLPANTSGTGLLEVCISTDGAGVFTPTGWTLVAQVSDASGTSSMSVFRHAATGATTQAFTFTGGATYKYISVYWSDKTGQDGTVGTATGFTTGAAAPSRTSSGANRRMTCWFLCAATASHTIGIPSGQTGVANNGIPAIALGYDTVGAGATGTRTATVTAGGWGAMSYLLD